METFQDTKGYALWAKIGVIAVTAVAAIIAIVDVVELGRVSTALTAGPEADLAPVDSIERTRAAVGVGKSAAVLFGGIAFMLWLHVAYKNIVALGATNLRRSPGWAIGAWFIPIMNLVWPKEITNDTWRGSEPSLPPGYGNAWTQVKVPAYVHWWWGVYLASGLLSGIGSGLAGFRSPTVTSTDRLDLMNVGLILDVIGIVGTVVACVLAVRLINDISSRQRRRYDEVGVPTGYAAPVGAPASGWGPPVAPPAAPPIAGPPPTPEPGGDFRPRPNV